MKKLLVVAAVAVVALSSACKKDYTCSCSGTNFSGDFVYKNVKKKDAKDACSTQNTSYAPAGISCSLK